MHHVVAVIVTMSRPRELDMLLTSLQAQSRPPDGIIVVENLVHEETAEVMARHPAARHLVSRRNLGGAGGFAYGIYAALAEGATHVWLMDDDGRPEDQGCLGALLAEGERRGADIASPIILDIADPARLAFPYFWRGRRLTRREDLSLEEVIEDFAHLFNGALVRAEAFGRYGLPDYRLFFRGDEVDFLHAVRRGGGRVVTFGSVGFLHPSGAPEVVPVVPGRLYAVVPTGDLKQFYFYRNRGYLVRRHRLVRQGLSDLIRYPLYFLVKRRGDWAGLARWAALTWRGATEDFRGFEAKR